MLKKDAVRFCSRYQTCSQCELSDHIQNGCVIYTIAHSDQDAEDVIAKVMRWAKEHPPESEAKAKATYASEYFKAFPHAQFEMIAGKKVPVICVRKIGAGVYCNSMKDCLSCWYSPVPKE